MLSGTGGTTPGPSRATQKSKTQPKKSDDGEESESESESKSESESDGDHTKSDAKPSTHRHSRARGVQLLVTEPVAPAAVAPGARRQGLRKRTAPDADVADVEASSKAPLRKKSKDNPKETVPTAKPGKRLPMGSADVAAMAGTEDEEDEADLLIRHYGETIKALYAEARASDALTGLYLVKGMQIGSTLYSRIGTLPSNTVSSNGSTAHPISGQRVLEVWVRQKRAAIVKICGKEHAQWTAPRT